MEARTTTTSVVIVVVVILLLSILVRSFALTRFILNETLVEDLTRLAPSYFEVPFTRAFECISD